MKSLIINYYFSLYKLFDEDIYEELSKILNIIYPSQAKYISCTQCIRK